MLACPRVYPLHSYTINQALGCSCMTRGAPLVQGQVTRGCAISSGAGSNIVPARILTQFYLFFLFLCLALFFVCLQWVDELQRHTLPGSLSIKVYSGQPQAAAPPAKGSRSRSSSPAAGSSVRGAAAATAAGGKAAASNEVVTAAQLAAADIVLTTYDIIRREVALQPSTEGAPERNLRHRKRCVGV